MVGIAIVFFLQRQKSNTYFPLSPYEKKKRKKEQKKK